eukprot:GGOE01057581.1.p1 GENE.GGOE01057581.1~~GGOE01057581.1.p1  ORF type:complete len:143 (-),score=8.70 GGOE01057581.1:285-713(-)
MMLLEKSHSPHEMKIFVPEILYESLPTGTALVLMSDKSLPAPGSVRHMVPVHSPVVSFGRNLFFISSEANSTIHSTQPWLSIGYINQVQLAVAQNSVFTVSKVQGKFCPPYSGAAASVGQPPSTYCAYASFQPGGVVTLSPS